MCLQGQEALTTAGLNPSLRPTTHLERAESEGWIEMPELRTPRSSSFKTQEGKVVVYNSSIDINFLQGGNLTPIDIRCESYALGWKSEHRADPIYIDAIGNAHLHFSTGSYFLDFSKTIQINGNPVGAPEPGKLTNGTHLDFENLLPGVSKTYDFKPGGVKYSYILNSPQTVSGSWYTITEEWNVPANCKITGWEGEGEYTNEVWNGALAIQTKSDSKPMGKIYPLICFDQNNAVVQGSYKIIPGKTAGKFELQLNVPSAWLNDPARHYPITIDPLVTGPTTTFPSITRPSCFFPSYNVDSILVTVPAGISVTNMSVTCSFYANPFTTTVMADGRMFFSTSCDDSDIFQVLPPAGSSPGTAYLDNFNLNNPLMCCYPQNCSSYSFYLKYHLSRTTNGTLCNTTYLYYDPFGTSWPFACYVEGYTPEAYGPIATLIPTSVCANTCNVDMRMYVRYGVPPYTFTHPWSSDTIVAGTAAGCSGGNQVKTITLDIPGCPNYCDPSTSLTVPPPVVTDACGVVLPGFDPSYTLTIKPVPIASFDVDTIKICSGESILANLSSCLPGATLSWIGNGLSGTTIVGDTLNNFGTSYTTTTYAGSVSLGGCTGIGDTLTVLTWPYAQDSFILSSQPYIINQDINFTNISSMNGNTELLSYWTFGDGDTALVNNPAHSYSDTGSYIICHFTETELGCSDTSCQEIYVIDIELILPNIITPNADGINDALYIKAIEYYPGNKVMVFNRWGNKIFETTDYKNDWKAPGVADGVYYYVLEAPTIEPKTSILHISRGN